MIRRHIHFQPAQIDFLEKESRRTGAAVSELVRRAVDSTYKSILTKGYRPLAGTMVEEESAMSKKAAKARWAKGGKHA